MRSITVEFDGEPYVPKLMEKVAAYGTALERLKPGATCLMQIAAADRPTGKNAEMSRGRSNPPPKPGFDCWAADWIDAAGFEDEIRDYEPPWVRQHRQEGWGER